MNKIALAARKAIRGNYSGTEVDVMDRLTGVVTTLFVPETFHYRDRSKYVPHQGKREMERRRFQLGTGILNG